MDATAQELIARLRRNPDDANAFASLRAHYQRVGDYASLANLLEGWAGRARDRSAGARALFDAGELVLGALSDRERAIGMYERAVALDPGFQDVYLRLRGLFEDAGEMRRLSDLLERRAAALLSAGGDEKEAAILYHQLGELWERRFSRADKAVGHYRRAFELDPGFVAALYAAREIYRAAGNLDAAATLLEKEAKVEPDAARRLALWRELAHVRAEQLDDPESATLALKRALADAPNDVEVMSDLARLYLTRARRTDDEHVAASDRHRAADLLYQMAQHVPREHALAYLEQALDEKPDHDGALGLLERVCDDSGQRGRLPARWVAYLAHAPDRPEAAHRRKRLAEAYLEAGQVEYAITCLEWLLEAGDAEAAERLIELYRRVGREDDAVRALGIAAQGLPPAKRVPRLRELMTALRDRGDWVRAGELAAQILQDEPGDPEALHLLEDACRQSGDYGPLREALLAASRIGGLSPHLRRQRLEQVALLCERELNDPEGAISAWRGVIAIDFADVQARRALDRLLTAAERWDELVALLEREARASSEPGERIETYRRLARIHRDWRGDLQAAVVALRDLRDLAPDDEPARDELCDALLQAGGYLEAIPLLRKRIDASSGEARAQLSRTLAQILEEHAGDDEGAFECWAQILDENPDDLAAIGRMEAIDEAAGRYERLLSTLSYKVEILPEADKPAVLVRMASIADRHLDDLARAAELYGRALEPSASNVTVLDALCDVFERSDRYKDLIVLLREHARREDDPRRRAELYRRIARTLATQVGNDEAAAEAWTEVLAAGEDEEALRFLRRHAARSDDCETLDDLLARLAPLIDDDVEKRDVLLERATVLSERLDRPVDAIAVLREVLESLAPGHLETLRELAVQTERVGDMAGLCDALWRQLDVLEDAPMRVPIARRLADLHEEDVPDPRRAIDALYAWTAADPSAGAPLSRLEPLLESESRWADLVDVLDRWAALVTDPAEVSRLVRRSAEVSHKRLRDVEGAWERLEPRVRSDDAEAEVDLRDLARVSDSGPRLAELYVSLAQGAADTETQKRRWLDAAEVYEGYLGDFTNALEAVLRAFAVDLTDPHILDEADRLAAHAGAWSRLSQVYETLLRRAESTADKTALLTRHARILDESARDVSAALDQTLRACSLRPDDDDLLALAEERAPRAGRADELLITYDKRRASAPDDDARVDALLRSAAWCERTLGDRQRARSHLAQALALTVRSPELSEHVEGWARRLDEEAGRPELRFALVEIQAALADDMEEDPVGGATLLRRASRLCDGELGDAAGALSLLVKAATYAPSEDAVLDELEGLAGRMDRLDELDRHLHRLVEEALDSRTAAGLLRRRGRLLEERLSRPAQAAEAWAQLASVIPDDPEARTHLRSCLRAAGKHQDLLVALQRDLRRASDPTERLEVLREIARVWDEDLSNRWEALDAWKKVAAEAPGDVEAAEAIDRLGQRGRAPEAALVDEPSGEPYGAPAESTDPSVETPEALSVSEASSARLSSDDFSDLTDPSEEESVEQSVEPNRGPPRTPPEDDSSETVLDDGLYAELRSALQQASPREGTRPPVRRDAETAQLRPPRETKQLDASGAHRSDEARPGDQSAHDATFGAAPGSGGGAEDDAAAHLAAPRPGRPEQDFEDDYTAVADDVFDQLKESIAAQRQALAGGEVVEELPSAEIELLDDEEALDLPRRRSASPDAPRRSPPRGLEEVEDLEAIDAIEEIEEIEEIDAIEEIDDLEELDELPAGSAPPPRRD